MQLFLEILDSETKYSTVLSSVVEALDKAMNGRRENVAMAKRLEFLEERLRRLELSVSGTAKEKKAKTPPLVD